MKDEEHPTVGSARTATDVGTPIPEPAEPTGADKAAPAAGAAAGAVAGGTAGTLVAGPIGTAIGAITGAVGGWWAGHGAERNAQLAPHDESWYRAQWESSAARMPGTWEQARPAYQLGHAAGSNPAYRGRSFSDIESDLRHGWTTEAERDLGSWDLARENARAAYERRVGTALGWVEGNDQIADSRSEPRRSFADPLPRSAESGPSGHPGIARGADDLPASASAPSKLAGRPDAGPHATDVTGREGRPNP